ncbi:MAG: ABC transporter substrate-binding protein [Nitrospinota bacterium]
MRWKWLCSIAGVVALALAVAVSPAAAQKGPIKIGLVAPLTGFFAAVGKDMKDGFDLWFEEHPGDRTVAGRKIKVVYEDTLGKPAINVTKVRDKLIKKDKVHVVIGGLLASTGYALAPVVTRYKTPMLYPVMAADDLTQRKRKQYKYVVRTGWTSSQPSHPFGEWAYKELGIRKVITIGSDYAFGYEVTAGFQRSFEEAGGKVVAKIWNPIKTTDFGPYIARIKDIRRRTGADGLFVMQVGGGSLRFPKQLAQAGEREKFKAILGGGTTADEFVLPAQGDEVIGYYTPLQYSAAVQNPINRAFVKRYRARFGKQPSYYSETMYTSARWIVEAAKKINGNVEDKELFLKTLCSMEFPDTPRGPVRMDPFCNPIHNIYVRKVAKIGGEKWNTVVKIFPMVSQFWKYDPKEFLKKPVYDRNHPPCRHCE